MSSLFVALRPSPSFRAALGALMHGVPGARWQDDAQLHLTLRYIGPVAPRQIDDICLALERVRAEPIEIAGAGVGAFGAGGRTNALWAGVTPSAPLKALHGKIDRALVTAGLPPEGRAYLPHVTVARLARGATAAQAEVAAWQARHLAFATEPEEVAHASLFETVPGPQGSIYQTLMRWPLTYFGT